MQRKDECKIIMAKVGRPREKTEYEKTINVAIPLSVLEKMKVATAKYNGNMTKYVNAVIKQDLDAHYGEYEQIYKLVTK